MQQDKPVWVINYGLGVDSTAILLEYIRNPASRPCPLNQMIVVTAMTGDEWEVTGRLVEEHMIPLFRAHGIRYVQVARHGPSKADGITVLDDSRGYGRLFIEGDYKLSQEMTVNGTVPQVGGERICSMHAKGEVIDKWLIDELGGAAFCQVIGFEANEQGRALRDAKYNTGADPKAGHPAHRTGIYPLVEWDWDRDYCERYIHAILGVWWPKSACVFCPFALTNCAGQDRVKELLKAEPAAGVKALMMEYASIALNPLQGLIKSVQLKSGMRWGRLANVLADSGEHTEIMQRFLGELATSQWRVYRVRRVAMPTDADPLKGAWNRSVEAIAEGTRSEMKAELRGLGDVEVDEDGIHRVYAARRDGSFPAYEEVYVAAPAGVQDKTPKAFITTLARYTAWAEEAA